MSQGRLVHSLLVISSTLICYLIVTGGERESRSSERRKGSLFVMGNSFKVPADATGIRSCSHDSTGNNGEANPKLRIYTFQELKIAANNFKSDNLVGQGSFGKVYKAWVDEKTLNPAKKGQGMAVAVKVWQPESHFGPSEWQREVDIIGRKSHPNLIQLLGHCRGNDKLLLVYEFMPNGTLNAHLFNKGTAQPLSWEQRLKIAAGTARGLAFLHAPDNNIIHRDFRPAHILLDSAFNPKLSGLALARAGPAEADFHVSTRVMGSYGYIAPEYTTTGHLNAKVDVYAFGVVLLQLLSGQKAIYLDELGKRQSLTEYIVARLSDNSKFDQLMDPKLEKDYPFEAALRAGQLAVQCVSRDPASRPTMNEVVQILEQINSDGSNKIN